MIFFDVSKAFDTVSHVPLLETLQNLNVKATPMRFIVSHHPPASFFRATLLNSLFIICCPLVKSEASMPSEYSKFLLRMLENIIFGNGRQTKSRKY
jgi:hypothetical protein